MQFLSLHAGELPSPMCDPLPLERTLSDMVLAFADEAGAESQFIGTPLSFDGDPAVGLAAASLDSDGVDLFCSAAGCEDAAMQDAEVC